MFRLIPVLFVCGVAAVSADQDDLMRFVNGDQLHGRFMGIVDGPRAVWKRNDLAEPVEFDTTDLRHVVLHGGRATKPLEALSYIGLVNGDQVPGKVVAMDGESVTLDTVYGGRLMVPREQISIMAPNPLGGRVYYHGPFVEDEWRMIQPSHPAVANKDEDAADESSRRWVFSGAAWYWQNPNAGTALVRDGGMMDRSVLRFDLSWKNRLSVAIGFHSDFAKPPEPDDEDEPRHEIMPGDVSNLPYLFGNSYVLQLYSNYLMLYRTTVTDKGGKLERVRLNNNNFRLGEVGRTTVELRCNRQTGNITLFLDDEYVAQWNEGDKLERGDAEYAGKGSGFGFVVQGDDTPVRISDVMVSEWNGMPDSARSLQMKDRDVVLMANGTDRYSGAVSELADDGRIVFEGRHGSFRFPLSDVAEIRFAESRLAEPSEEAADQLKLRLSPVGVISGKPLGGDASVLKLLSPVAGEIDVMLDYAVMLDLTSSRQIVDDWDAAF